MEDEEGRGGGVGVGKERVIETQELCPHTKI